LRGFSFFVVNVFCSQRPENTRKMASFRQSRMGQAFQPAMPGQIGFVPSNRDSPAAPLPQSEKWVLFVARFPSILNQLRHKMGSFGKSWFCCNRAAIL